MRNLKHISHLNLSNIIIPGTHNSGCARYDINNMVMKILQLYTICQSLSIYQQLKLGVSYLDLRFIFKNDNFLYSTQ